MRQARAAVPACAIGSLTEENTDELDVEELTNEVNMLFEYLGLETVGAARE